VYSNGPTDEGTGTDCVGAPNNSNYVNGVESGEKWQCPEFINRLYLTNGWTTSTWTGDAGQPLYNDAPSNLTKQATGSVSYLGPGDVVIINVYYNGSFDGGHALVVNSSSSVSSGTVNLVSQNSGYQGTSEPVVSGTISGGSVSVGGGGSGWSYTTIGVVHAPTTGPPPNGTFVSYQGNVYRIAGGAPLYINSWNPFGGPQPTTALNATQWASLRQFPLDGTTVSTADTGGIFKIAGGAALWLNSCDAGCGNPIAVEQYSINGDGTYPGGTPHLRPVPADGTTLSTADTGGVFKIAGGAPLWLNSCTPGCGAPIEVMQYTINSDGIDPWGPNALNLVPADGTTISTSDTGGVFKIAGGAPLYLSSCVAGCGNPVEVDQTMINSDAMDPWGSNNLNPVPVDGTFLQAQETGGLYRVAGGAPIYVSDCTALGFPSCDMPFVVINQYDITTDAADPWGPATLTAAPSNGTVLQGEPSGALWSYAAGCISSTTTSTGAVRVNDASVSQYILCPSITSTTLPAVKLGKAYSTTVSATGGTAPYTWSVVSGSLPTGLHLSSSGLISGTPTAAGAFSVVVQVTDSSALPLSATATYPFAIPLAVSPASLPKATLHKAYTATLLAKGGTSPYTWSVLSGTLPTGLTLSSTGRIVGKPSVAGTFTFTVEVADVSTPAISGTRTYTLKIL